MSLTAHRIILTLGTAIILLTIGIIAIFWARGFKISPQTGISRTGLIVANSVPDGAKVFLDDKLVSATNATISFLEPKNYNVKITKDGFTTWEKNIEVKADLINEIDALLFPLAPELKPLTLSGASNPQLSPDGQKIAYTSSGTEKGGIWINTMADGPLSFNKGPKNVIKNTTNVDFDLANITWSPSSDEILVQTTKDTPKYYLFDINRTNNTLTPISEAEASKTLADWQDTIRLLQTNLVSNLPESIQTIANQVTSEIPTATPSPTTAKTKTSLNKTESTESSKLSLNYTPFNLKFSPDEEKVLYRLNEGSSYSYRVYDIKLKKELVVGSFNQEILVNWYPNSTHLILTANDGISIIETDGSNKQLVFSGNFTGQKTAFPWPDGSKIVIEANFNTGSTNQSNLYTLILR